MIIDAKVWQLVNPEESIEESRPLVAAKTYQLSTAVKDSYLELLKQDGYCYIPALIDVDIVDRMFRCVQKMIEKSIPPVFCFVYDIFWEIILRLDPIMRDFLQGECLVIPNVWTWVVDGTKEKAYFPPHRDVMDEDFIDDQGMPTLFSLWIPLTDVSTQNSCMYLLPASRDPGYPHEAAGWRERWMKEGHKPWKVEDLVNIRALPAPKGSILGWNAGVMHWGSKPHPKASKRISIGYYFHASHAKKKHAGLVDLTKSLSLQSRFNIIFESLRIYGKSLSDT